MGAVVSDTSTEQTSVKSVVKNALSEQSFKNKIYLAGDNTDNWSPYKNKEDAQLFLEAELGDIITFVDNHSSSFDYIVVPKHTTDIDALRKLGGKNCWITDLDSFVSSYIRPDTNLSHYVTKIYLAGAKHDNWGPYTQKSRAAEVLRSHLGDSVDVFEHDQLGVDVILIPNNRNIEDNELRAIGGKNCLIRPYQWYLNEHVDLTNPGRFPKTKKEFDRTQNILLLGDNDDDWKPCKDKKDAQNKIKKLLESSVRFVDKDATNFNYIIIPNTADEDDIKLQKLGGTHCTVEHFDSFFALISGG
jgi:hypothetical protein